MIGQKKLQFWIDTWYKSGTKQNLLLRGGPGMGKTMFAEYYAARMAKCFWHYIPCSVKNIKIPQDDEPVVLDEIHLLKEPEAWYDRPNLLVGCTTEGAPVPEALRSRMFEFWMAPYSLKELSNIILESYPICKHVAKAIARRSRGSPRNALLITTQVVAIFHNKPYTVRDVELACDSVGFFDGGFTENDHKYIEFLQKAGSASYRTIARSLGLPEATILEEIEPFLLKKGIIKITSKGRELCGSLS